MESTCIRSCKSYKKRQSCPNYLATTWLNDKGETKELEDCAPRRILIMLQEMHNTLIGLQKASEQQRNTEDRLTSSLLHAMEYISNTQGKVTLKLTGGEDGADTPVRKIPL